MLFENPNVQNRAHVACSAIVLNTALGKRTNKYCVVETFLSLSLSFVIIVIRGVAQT